MRQDTLVSLLGGRRGAFDATAPLVVFILTWLLTGDSIGWAAGASLACAGVIAGVRLGQRRKPRAVILGLLSVAAAVLVVLYTGRAQDILLPRIVSNAASALVWAGFIVFRRPLLGLIVGGLLGQRTTWRLDPALLRAYSLASWAWVAMYALRVAILTPFWNSDSDDLAVIGGGVAQVALSWPLLVLCLIVSGWIIKAALPEAHPGLRHPIDPSEPAASEKAASLLDPLPPQRDQFSVGIATRGLSMPRSRYV